MAVHDQLRVISALLKTLALLRADLLNLRPRLFLLKKFLLVLILTKTYVSLIERPLRYLFLEAVDEKLLKVILVLLVVEKIYERGHLECI